MYHTVLIYFINISLLHVVLGVLQFQQYRRKWLNLNKQSDVSHPH